MEYKKLKDWQHVLEWKEPVFILGNGPSLNDIDLSILDSYFTLGINRIFKKYSPTVLFWQDSDVWNTCSNAIIKEDSIKVCRRGVTGNKESKYDFLTFELRGKRKFEWPEICRTNILIGRDITMNIASQFAIGMGASALVLLGADCKYKDGKTNFYGKNKRHSSTMLPRCINILEKIKANSPIPIYNCSLNECWRQRTLDSAIEELSPPKRNKAYYKKLLST